MFSRVLSYLVNGKKVLLSLNKLISFCFQLRQLRAQFLVKSSGISRLDFELLQTQSSLLLAHAQIERQKLEMRAISGKVPKRPHSYHGEDLLHRTVKYTGLFNRNLLF